MSESPDLRLWPVDASAEYVEARARLLAAERRLRDVSEEVASARRDLPRGTPVRDYVFDEGPRDLAVGGGVTSTTLSDLFGSHQSLVVYHLMYGPDDDDACPMCSMWVDGWHGVAHHLTQRTGLAVIAKAPLPKLREWGRRRGWDGLRLLSSAANSFNADLDMENEGAQRPGVSVFVRSGPQVLHQYSVQAAFSAQERERGIDPLCPTWQVLDLLPAGRGDWYAGNDYPGRDRG